jgi:thiol-disulfide isomerase/thioredoxin
MPTKQVILWLLGLFLLGTIVYFISGRYSVDNLSQPTNQETRQLDDTGQPPSQTDQSLVAQNNRYQNYSEGAFTAAQDQRRVLFFYAPWCPTCRPLNQQLSENTNQIPEDVVIFRTNYDTSTKLKNQYGVTYQHTFVQVDRDGNKLKIWNGGNLQDLLENIL